MKRLTRREFTAAGIIATLSAGISALPGCGAPEAPSEFDPSENEEVDVYGPPSDDVESDEFEPDRNEMELVYGPPPDDAFEVQVNVSPTVYGPPDVDSAD